MTELSCTDLRLVVLILETIHYGLGSVIAVLGGDVEDAREREKRRLEADTYLDQQATIEITEEEPHDVG